MKPDITFSELQEIVQKLDPDDLLIKPMYKRETVREGDHLKLYSKKKLGINSIYEVPDRGGILFMIYLKSDGLIDLALDPKKTQALRQHPVLATKPYLFRRTDHAALHFGKFEPYRLLTDENGNTLPDIQSNRIPSDILAAVYEVYTGVNLFSGNHLGL